MPTLSYSFTHNFVVYQVDVFCSGYVCVSVCCAYFNECVASNIFGILYFGLTAARKYVCMAEKKRHIWMRIPCKYTIHGSVSMLHVFHNIFVRNTPSTPCMKWKEKLSLGIKLNNVPSFILMVSSYCEKYFLSVYCCFCCVPSCHSGKTLLLK